MKRITLFAGHYGSGKTSIAVSYTKYLVSLGLKTTIIDLDIVNPYFRTKDSEEELKKSGINIISSAYANTNLDAPALPKEIYQAIADKSTYLVIDVGGDDRGAVALGRFAPDILSDEYEMLFVANFYRPLTRSAEEALEVMKEIELAGHIPFTGIVNNSNLGNETTLDIVTSKIPEADKLSKISNLPIVMLTATDDLYDGLKTNQNLFKIKLQDKYYDISKGEN